MVFYPQSGAWDSVGKSTPGCVNRIYSTQLMCLYISITSEKNLTWFLTGQPIGEHAVSSTRHTLCCF